MKRTLILDFPSDFLFPPNGYGGIERWLWSVAKQSAKLGHEVILSGPLWQTNCLPSAKHFKKRINKDTYREFLDTHAKVDYLVGGHEYWESADMRRVFALVSD